MKIRRIQTKFVLIVSILMALVMALQFYFTGQTQSDVISELARLEKNINTVTDQLVTENLIARFPRAEQLAGSSHSQILKQGISISKELRSSYISDSVRTAVTWQSYDSVINKFKFVPNASGLKKITTFKSVSGFGDSLETLVIDLSAPAPMPAPKELSKGFASGKGDSTFSFTFPGAIVRPNAPSLVRYNYSTADLSSALNTIRDRNLIITLLLFAFSIIAVILIAGSLTKPVKELNRSFDRVIKGELDVRVEPRQNDEMGELAHSFNHMVSELKKNREKEELLHRKERLAALGQLAAGVAHEIKNPLNAINLTIEHLRDRFVDKDDGRTLGYISTVQSEIQRLDETVNNFLSYVRSENLELKKQDVVPLIRETLQLYERELAQNDILLSSNLKPLPLDVDAGRFKTVIMNLVINAIQAMPNGGKLNVKTTAAKKIYVEDSGVGIAAKNRENIFDLFYTTKSGGTGLGLPTAYKIVEAHGGRMEINSSENEGTSVLIDFSQKDKT